MDNQKVISKDRDLFQDKFNTKTIAFQKEKDERICEN